MDSSQINRAWANQKKFSHHCALFIGGLFFGSMALAETQRLHISLIILDSPTSERNANDPISRMPGNLLATWADHEDHHADLPAIERLNIGEIEALISGKAFVSIHKGETIVINLAAI